MAHEDLRCLRCSALLPGIEQWPASRVRDGALVVAADQTFAFPLCLPHAKEARDLLLHYVEYRISVLSGDRLCLTLRAPDAPED